MSDDLDERLFRAIHPQTFREVERIRNLGTRFVHYTSAESGMNILRSGRMLLRNSTLLNDFSEMQHGMGCLAYAYKSSDGERLKALMRRVQADLPEIFEENFDRMFFDVRAETYLISVSEHGDLSAGDEFEDAYGRLSMWRAYANQSGVAFVFKNTPFVAETNALNAYTCPVVYATPLTFLPYFAEMVDGIEGIIDDVIPFGGVWLHAQLVSAFRFAAQSTKHPAFREEREWRVVYTPTLLGLDAQGWEGQLERIPTEIMTLRGVPQRVYAIPFQNHPEDSFVGATIPELFDRVLIGPSPDAYAIAQAFVAELRGFGLEQAEDKVVVTNIPLRT